MGAAPVLPGCRALARTCTRSDPNTGGTPAAIPAGSRLRRRPGRPGCRAGGRRASGSSSACGSRRPNDQEVAAGVEDRSAAELVHELLGTEVALEDRPARAVLEHALLVAFRLDL